VQALDISSNNHNGMLFNWPDAFAAGYEVVYIKATQGDSYLNPYLIADVKDARAAGFKVGIYHYFDSSEPELQASWFKTNGLGLVGELLDLIPSVDVEQGTPGEVLERFVNDFIAYVGLPMLGYQNRNYFQQMKPNYAADWVAWPGWTEADGTTFDGIDMEMVQTAQIIVPGIGIGPTGKQLLTDISTVFDLAAIEVHSTVEPLPTEPNMEEVMQAVTNSSGQTVVYAASPAGHLLEFTKVKAETPPAADDWSVIDVTALVGPVDAGQPFIVQP
jgi:hypothetical protein